MPEQDSLPSSATKHYLLPPDICLSFTGSDCQARQAIEFMFDFCLTLPGPQPPFSDQVFAEIQINNNYLDAPLPDWIDTQISGRLFNDVHAFYGPNGETAALLSNKDGFVCGILSAEGNKIDITLGKQDGSITTMISPSAIFTPLIQETLQRRNHLIFHSAGLQIEGGSGIMILADSGGGKTTTALSLLRKGCSLLSDDLIICTSSDDSEPLIYGIPEPMNLTAATRNFFPELQSVEGLPTRDGVTDKVVFDPRSVYGDDCFGTSTSLNSIYFVEVSPGKPRLTPVPPQIALGKMIKGCTFAFNQKLSKTSGANLFDLVSRIPCFILHTGSDPDSLGIWLQEESKKIASDKRQK